MFEEEEKDIFGGVLTGHVKFITEWANMGFPKEAEKKAIALRIAGYTGNSPATQARNIINNPQNVKCIRFLMEKYDMGFPDLLKKHKEILNATHPFRPKQQDREVQRKGLDMAYKLGDYYPAQKVDIKKRTDASYSLNVRDIKRIEDCTGEKIIDAEIIEEEEGIEPI